MLRARVFVKSTICAMNDAYSSAELTSSPFAKYGSSIVAISFCVTRLALVAALSSAARRPGSLIRLQERRGIRGRLNHVFAEPSRTATADRGKGGMAKMLDLEHDADV